MKNKIIFLFVIVLMMILAMRLDSDKLPINRYHQHKEDAGLNVIKDAPGSIFSTHLPLMDIKTDYPIPEPYIFDEMGEKTHNNQDVTAEISYYNHKSQLTTMEDKADLTEKAVIRIRGRSSRAYPKKGFLLKFKKDDLIENKDVSLSGMTSGTGWVLHGPYLDKTLIRNYLSYNLAGEIMEYSPNVRFLELFLNGEYLGLYLLTERIDFNEDGRIRMSKTDPQISVTSYIIRADVGSNDPLYEVGNFNYYTGKNGSKSKRSGLLEIIYPSSTLTRSQKDYIESDISGFEKALASYDSSNQKYGYPSFIDIDSFVDYFIINEFTMNSDAGRLSTYFYKDVRGKLKTAVWDFNSAFNNYIPGLSEPHYFMMADKTWFDVLLKDRSFVEKVEKRYRELRKTFLSDEYLFNYIDETVAFLGPAIDRNYEKWGFSYQKSYDLLSPEERNPRDYEESIEQLKDMIEDRGKYMDEQIRTLYTFSHESVNKQFRFDAGEKP